MVSPGPVISPTTDPPMEKPGWEQTMLMLLTFPLTVPLPLTTVQVCTGVVGCVRIVTAYAAPLIRGLANVKFTLPVPLTLRLSPPLSCKVNPVPRRPVTEPLMVKTGAQTTCTVVTFAVAVPVPLATLQVWVGLEGWVLIMTLYVPPLAIEVLKVKATVPVPVTGRSSPPLSCRTRPLPLRPSTLPPMVNGPVAPPEPEPEPEPEPDPEPDPDPDPEPVPPVFLRPLQEVITSAIIATHEVRESFIAGFIGDTCSLAVSVLRPRMTNPLGPGVSEHSLRVLCLAIRRRERGRDSTANTPKRYVVLGPRLRWEKVRINRTGDKVCPRNYYALGTFLRGADKAVTTLSRIPAA